MGLNMSTYHLVSIGKAKIETTVVSNELALDKALSCLLSKMENELNSRTRGFVGFFIEKSFISSFTTLFVKNKVALLKFCVGNYCLIVHLIRFTRIPTSLSMFLNFPSLTFFGTKIKQDLADLERDYGLQCKNAVDLAQLVDNSDNIFTTADVYDAVKMMEISPTSSVLDLDLSLMAMIIRKIPGKDDFVGWDLVALSREQIYRASIDAYSAFLLAVHLSS